MQPPVCYNKVPRPTCLSCCLTAVSAFLKVALVFPCTDTIAITVPVIHSRVATVFGGREGLCGPIDEAVEEDKACKARPSPEDGFEGHPQIINHLKRSGVREKK